MNLKNSLSYLERAKKVIPVCSQTFSKGYRYFPQGAYPVYIKSGKRSYVWDVDRNIYTDYIMALGPITLGYNYPKVNEAIRRQLMNGIIFSLPHLLEVELSELLVDIIPCAEMVRFSKTGSEVTSAAIRAARAYTGRDHIAFRGYHGWHEWYSVSTERSKGIPNLYNDFIHEFEYNNIKSLEEILEKFPGKIAAVIMEPTIDVPPENNFLQQVRHLTREKGTLLIFDEIVTGFRLALGGAQEYFNVIPDLATFGEGLANGMPLNAVVGRADIMKEFEEVFFSTTFGGECLSLAAGLATIKEVIEKDVISHVWKVGERLMKGLEELGLEVAGYPYRPIITTEFNSKTRALLLQELVKRRVLLHSNLFFNLCYTHTENEIDLTLEAFAESLEIVNRAIEKNQIDELLEGEIMQPV